MSRIPATFARLRAEGRTGLVAYITTGYPSLAETPELVRAMVDGGADLIELGVPFSDPLADGTTVQRATHVAVEAGVTLADVLDACRRIRAMGIEAPLTAMTYLNPILAYGLPRFARDAAEAGLDGVIPVDVPPEEGGPLKEALAEQLVEWLCT
jgi:tryptophan synthase alpha subunit